MPRTARTLTSSMRLAFLLLLLTTVSLSWFAFDTFVKYELKLQRISSANQVLHDLEQLARLTVLEQQALGERFGAGWSLASPPAGRSHRAEMRAVVTRLRETPLGSAAPWQAGYGNGIRRTVPEALDRAEEFLAISTLVHEALDDRRASIARGEWARLNESGLPGELNTRLESAIRLQGQNIRALAKQSVTNSPYTFEILPWLILAIAFLSFMLAWLGSRSLSRSAEAIHQGARAFAEGDFTYRIPSLKVPELAGLASTLNAMAARFIEHRKTLQEAATKLETIILQRTRELTVSNQKLAEVDIARQQLLSNISHEFRTPLTAIRGQAEIALRGKSKTEEEYRDAFERILGQAQHATAIVDDLLFIARADAGEPRLEWSSVSVVKLVEAVCEDFQTTAGQRKITIDLILKVRNAVVRGDARRLRQVFAILLDNALRYSNIGGAVEVTVWLADTEVCIEFRDHGIGLDEQEASKAFERFYRSRRAQEHSRGTGLGLSVAKAIVEAHSGSISLTGEPGAGAKATLELPLHLQFKGTP